jgi:hypothetical protein
MLLGSICTFIEGEFFKKALSPVLSMTSLRILDELLKKNCCLAVCIKIIAPRRHNAAFPQIDNEVFMMSIRLVI